MKRTLSALVLFVFAFSGFVPVASVRADEPKPVTIQAQGNAYHNDFVVASNKRGDLRISLVKKGLDAAFTEWLKVEHPSAYREAQTQALAALSHPRGGLQAASAFCCAKDGQCCKSNCAQCCAKGVCRMSCCEMTTCKTMRLACCK